MMLSEYTLHWRSIDSVPAFGQHEMVKSGPDVVQFGFAGKQAVF